MSELHIRIFLIDLFLKPFAQMLLVNFLLGNVLNRVNKVTVNEHAADSAVLQHLHTTLILKQLFTLHPQVIQFFVNNSGGCRLG